MKKNITINLYGTLYHIDEDAYDLLSRYEKSLRRYFARQEGGDEIADDLERRVAELLEELRAEGVEAITIEHVESVIRRIGRPEELDAGADERKSAAGADFERLRDDLYDNTRRWASDVQRRKLFRDPNDRMLGGVTAGLSHYLGLCNPLWLRLLLVALCFVSFGTVLVAYLVLWLLIPEARTPEDMLRMEGKPVTPGSLGEEIMGSAAHAGPQDADAAPTAAPERRGFDSVLGFLGAVLRFALFVLAGVALVMAGLALFGLTVFIIVLLLVGVGGYPLFGIEGWLQNGGHPIPLGLDVYFWLFVGGSWLALMLAVYGGVTFFMRRSGRMTPLRPWQRAALVAPLVVAVAVAVASGYVLTDGIRNNAFPLANYADAGPDRGWGGEWLPDGFLYLHGRDTYDWQKTHTYEHLKGGYWRAVVPVSVNGRGCYLFAADDSGRVVRLHEVPLTKQLPLSRQGKVEAALRAKDETAWRQLTSEADSSTATGLCAVVGWEVLDSIPVVPGRSITVGVTTSPTLTHDQWVGTDIAYWDALPLKMERQPAQ